MNAISESTEITTTKPAQQPLARFTPEQIKESIISDGTELPSLSQTRAAPVPLSVDYWSPDTEGDSKRGWIIGITSMEVPDMENGEIRDLESVLLVEECDDGKKRRWFNASRVLVGNVKDAIRRGEIIPASILTPVQIVYRGQKKNRSNQRLSKRWEILPLIVAQQ
jgi:hypothetical protein